MIMRYRSNKNSQWIITLGNDIRAARLIVCTHLFPIFSTLCFLCDVGGHLNFRCMTSLWNLSGTASRIRFETQKLHRNVKEFVSVCNVSVVCIKYARKMAWVLYMRFQAWNVIPISTAVATWSAEVLGYRVLWIGSVPLLRYNRRF